MKSLGVNQNKISERISVIDAGYIIMLIILAYYLYRDILTFWWLDDDPMVLKHAVQHSPVEYFLNPSIWRELSVANLTPWITLSYDFDWYVAGWNPWLFYLHHLFVACSAILVLYFLFRLFFTPFPSLLGTLIILLSAPFSDVVHHLYKRHYLEGLIFASLAVILYVYGLRIKIFILTLLATLFYTLAITAKEIYVPLVLILFFLPESSSLILRLKHIIPLVVVAFLYVIWRKYMLGVFIGGYGMQSPSLFLNNLMELFFNIFNQLLYTNSFHYIILLLGILPGVIIFFRVKIVWKIFWIVFIISVVLPILPILNIFSPHYFLFPYLCFSIIIISGYYKLGYLPIIKDIKRLNYDSFRYAIPMILFLINFVIITPVKWKEPIMERVRAEGEFMINPSSYDAFLFKPLLPYWHHQGLVWFREHFFHITRGVRGTIQDDCYKINRSITEKMFYQYDIINSEIIPIKIMQPCNIVNNVRLGVKIVYYNNLQLSWELGPYNTGRYFIFAFENGIEMGREINERIGSFRLSIPHNSNRQWIVKYISDEGWVSYSPFLTEKKQNQNEVLWEIEWKK